MTKFRVQFPGREHSKGRGIGRYTKSLIEALEKTNEVELVDTNPDLIHYGFFDLFYHTLPNSLFRPTIVTVHDLTPLVLPKLYPQGLRSRLSLAAQKRAVGLDATGRNALDDLLQQRRIVLRHGDVIEKE